MTKRFLVAAEGLTKENEKEFISFLRENTAAWWHWIDGFWLIKDKNGNLSCRTIRDKLSPFKFVNKCIVLEIAEDIDWAGLKPSGEDNMMDWLKKTWIDN